MVAYSFKGRFVGPIDARTKRQTIRSVGKKRHAREGDKVQIYTGDRFHPRKVGDAVCERSGPITLNFGSATRRPFVVVFSTPEAAQAENIILTPDELDAFAVRDGFADWQDLADFWTETHGQTEEWSGVIITWGDSFASFIPAGA